MSFPITARTLSKKRVGGPDTDLDPRKVDARGNQIGAGTPAIAALLQRFRSLELRAIHLLYPQADLLGLFQIRLRNLETHRDHSVDLLVRRDLVFDRKSLVKLLAQKLVVLQELLEVGLRNDVPFHL